LGNRDQLHDATPISKAHPRLVLHHVVLEALNHAARAILLYTLTTIGRVIHRATKLSIEIDVKTSSSTRFRKKRGG
jgi:hypothetical protein